jgi:predicted nucleic acid-binding protein
MVTHGIRTLLTENDQDFMDMSEIRAVNPFASSSRTPQKP